MIRALVLSVALLFGAGGARAEYFTGSKLLGALSACSATEPDAMIKCAIGLGYVVGVFDASQRAAHCAPDGVPPTQLVQVVVAHLMQNPHLHEKNADGAIVDLLARGFPCPKEDKGV